MPNYQVQFNLHTDTALPEDFSQNNWSINADDVSALSVAVGVIKDFYDDLVTYYSPQVVQNGHTVKAYDRADPQPRPPVLEEVFNFSSAPAGGPLPQEVACVLSFQGSPAAGIPQARRRGRIYLGPLDISTVDTQARPLFAFRSAIATAATAVLTASDAAAAWTWDVWSTVSNDGTPVTNGWVDNAFDTQRRRGYKPTSRIVWS